VGVRDIPPCEHTEFRGAQLLPPGGLLVSLYSDHDFALHALTARRSARMSWLLRHDTPLGGGDRHYPPQRAPPYVRRKTPSCVCSESSLMTMRDLV